MSASPASPSGAVSTTAPVAGLMTSKTARGFAPEPIARQ